MVVVEVFIRLHRFRANTLSASSTTMIMPLNFGLRCKDFISYSAREPGRGSAVASRPRAHVIWCTLRA